MSDGKNDWVREVDFVWVLADGGCDDRWVDDDRVVGSHGVAAKLHAGILSGKVDADVFVQDKRYSDLACKKMIGKEGTVRTHEMGRSMQTHICEGLYWT